MSCRTTSASASFLALVILGAIPSFLAAGVAPLPSFVRGDGNIDGRVDISDVIFVLGCQFLGTRCPDCLDAADANDDGNQDIADPRAS